MKTCTFVAKGNDTDEVMKKAADHAKTAHGMATIPPDVETKARAVIRDA
jgi:predicted small metal-binding protein